MTKKTAPTSTTYKALQAAYDHMNKELFNGELPDCLITLQRKSKARGYFCQGRFRHMESGNATDEIALNPQAFEGRTAKMILSTLAHEMVHLWQAHHGKPSRSGYHNREWALRMMSVGLAPSDTGLPGGKQTGQSMSHYVEPGGPFDLVADEMLKRGMFPKYMDSVTDQGKAGKQSKVTYICPQCDQRAWAKPGALLMCGQCVVGMVIKEDL